MKSKSRLVYVLHLLSFIVILGYLNSGCDLVKLKDEPQQKEPTNNDNSFAALVDSAIRIDIEIKWSYYDIATDPDTFAASGDLWFWGKDLNITSGSKTIKRDSNNFTVEYTYNYLDENKLETTGKIFVEGTFNATRDTIEYFKASESRHYPSYGNSWWDDNWEIVITDFIPLNSPDFIKQINGHRVIEYYIKKGFDAQYIAWKKVSAVYPDSTQNASYEVHNTIGGNRFLEPLIQLYLPD